MEKMVGFGPKEFSCWVRMQAPFIVKGEVVKSNTSCFPSASRGEGLISSSLKSFTGEPSQDASCELNKGILLYSSLPWKQGSRDGLYV